MFSLFADIMLYPNKVSLPDDDKQTEDVDDDEVTDANANLTNAVDKEGSVKSGLCFQTEF